MKRILSILLSVVMLASMCMICTYAADDLVYVSTVSGNNANDGLSASSAKKTLGSKTGDGALGVIKNGGTMVVFERLIMGAKDTTYKFNVDGHVTITANDGKVDYKNPAPATNPAAGSLKMAGGAKVELYSDVTLDDIILFQEAAQNTWIVKSGATLTVTDKVVTMTKQDFYMNIEVEEGATAIINGGTFSNVSGAGKIEIGKCATVLDGNNTTPTTPTTPENPSSTEVKVPSGVKGAYAYISTTEGDNANSGLSATAEKKTMGNADANGAYSLVKDGGTIIVTEKWQMGTYTINASGLITITGNDGDTDFKFPYPSSNPGGGAVKLASGGATITIESDVTFDDIILFQEGKQGVLHVKSGATLTVTDLCVLMSQKDYHYKVVIDEGATAVLSKAAQETFTFENNGTIVDYVPENTIVKLTIGSKQAYINNVAHTLDAAPINRNNRTMLPVRFLANAFGVDNDGIKWDSNTRTATLTNSEVTIVVTIDAPSMTVNGETVALDSPAIIENNRTYLPVRAIANALGVSNDNIKWDGATNTATLVK